MRVTADTNVLVRATVGDNEVQTRAARKLLSEASQVAIPVTVFCEFAWVLRTIYRYSKPQIASAIERYLEAEIVATDRASIQAGLTFLSLGGDFSDGAVAHEGRQMGGTIFASFDRDALKLLDRLGHSNFSP